MLHFSLLFTCSVLSYPFVTPWTVAHQAPLPVGFPRQEHWSGLLFPSLGDLPDPRREPTSPALAGGFFTPITLSSTCIHFPPVAPGRTPPTAVSREAWRGLPAPQSPAAHVPRHSCAHVHRSSSLCKAYLRQGMAQISGREGGWPG